MTKRIKLPPFSHLQKTPLFQIKDKRTKTLTSVYTWGRWERIDFEPRADDLFHLVTDGDVGRLDLLAKRYYEDVNMWWVIADANLIWDPFNMEVNVLLRIPNPLAVRGVLEGDDIQSVIEDFVDPLQIDPGLSNTFNPGIIG